MGGEVSEQGWEEAADVRWVEEIFVNFLSFFFLQRVLFFLSLFLRAFSSSSSSSSAIAAEPPPRSFPEVGEARAAPGGGGAGHGGELSRR